MKAIKDLFTIFASLRPAARTATASGSTVDLANQLSNMVVFEVGTITDGTHTPTVEESDASGSGFTTVAAADLVGTLAALATNTDQKVGYIGKKRYVRAVVTVAGATTGGVYGAHVITQPRKLPAA